MSHHDQFNCSLCYALSILYSSYNQELEMFFSKEQESSFFFLFLRRNKHLFPHWENSSHLGLQITLIQNAVGTPFGSTVIPVSW